MAVISKTTQLHWQIYSAGIGDINTGDPALFGNCLSAHVLLQSNREISSSGKSIFIGKNHAVFAMNCSYSCNNSAAWYMTAFLLLINNTAIEFFLADIISCIQTNLKKICAGINKHFNQVSHRLFTLL